MWRRRDRVIITLPARVKDRSLVVIDFFRPNTNLNNNSSRYANGHLAAYKSCTNAKAHINELLLRWWWCEFYSPKCAYRSFVWFDGVSRSLLYDRAVCHSMQWIVLQHTWSSLFSAHECLLEYLLVPNEFHSWGRLSIWPGLSGCRSVCKMVYNKSCAPREYVLIAPRFPYLVQQNEY